MVFELRLEEWNQLFTLPQLSDHTYRSSFVLSSFPMQLHLKPFPLHASLPEVQEMFDDLIS